MLSLQERLSALELADDLPSLETCSSLLEECSRLKNLGYAWNLHKQLHKYGLEHHTTQKLLPMFLACGSLADAMRIFHTAIKRDDYTWSILMQAYVERGEFDVVFSLFMEMEMDAEQPGRYTFASVVKACSKLKSLNRGREVHARIIKDGLEADLYIGNALVDMYAKCGMLGDASDVFYEIQHRNVVSWNSLITGYSDHGLWEEVLASIEQICLEELSLDDVTYIFGLKACGNLGAVDEAQRMHAELISAGFDREILVSSTVLGMYAKCGMLLEAQDVFEELPCKDVVAWTALIAGYAEHGFHENAVYHLEKMQLQDVSPNAYSWNVVMRSCSQQGEGGMALFLCAQMQEQGLLPGSVSFLSLLKACGSISGLIMSKRVHAQLYKNDKLVNIEVSVINTLIDTYAKCGELRIALEIFEMAPQRDPVGWTALMTGYMNAGKTEQVLYLIEKMNKEGIHIDEITCLNIFSACSHAGLVDTGMVYFGVILKGFGISLTHMQCNCILDLFVRAGQLDAAIVILEIMPFQPSLITWNTFLGACQKWNSLDLGTIAYKYAAVKDENQSATFILMSNVLADDQGCA